MEEYKSVLPNADQADTTNYWLAKICAAIGKGGGSIAVEDFLHIQNIVRAGMAEQLLTIADQFRAQRESDVTIDSFHGSITGASFANADAKETFLRAMGETSIGWYEFIFDGSVWKLGEEIIGVSLSTIGITVTGTPAEGDTVIVHEIGSNLIFAVLAPDKYDTPADGVHTHALSLGLQNCFANVQFSASQALVKVDATLYPSGLEAGTYNITLDHGAYGGGTAQDGTYQFTITQAVPAGGYIRHSTMGVYQSGGYTKAQITGGKFTTYKADFTTIESNIVTTEGGDGVNLGTASASNPTYKVGTHINFTERNAYGDNNAARSAMRQWLNSSAPSGWWTQKGQFDFPTTSPTAGFLHGLDPELLSVMGEVKKRTALCTADRADPGYVDTNEKVFLQSMSEVFGSNNTGYKADGTTVNVRETSFGADQTSTTPIATAYPYWVKHNTNAERIKYLSGSARHWLLRSPYPSLARGVRLVFTDGTLEGNRYDGANYAYGAVPSLCII